MHKPIKILHVFSRMNAGGAEIRTLEVMRHLDRTRFSMDFCSLSGMPGTLDEEIRSLGGQVHLCRLDRGFSRRFRALLRDGDYDVVHSHVYTCSGYFLRLAAQSNVAVRIAHFRTMGDGKKSALRRRAQHYLMRTLINRYATHILSVSKGAMDYGWKNSWQHDSRCRVVYNGIDLTRFFEPIDRADVKRELAIPEESTLLIHVGRFDDSKNHARLVSIFSRLRAMDKSAYLLLVGLGGNNSEQSIRDMVESLDLEPYVIFAGHRQDIPRLLKASDLMVFPSIREGLPGSVLEACAAGVPVVASDLPGSIEIAERFSTVRCLPLSLDDSIWVETIKNMLEMSKSTASRNEATDLFQGSDFDLNKCVKSFCSIWGTCN